MIRKKSVVAHLRTKGVAELSSRTIVENLKLPNNLYTSNASFCKVVHVFYELQIKIVGTRIMLPITISLVPVNQASPVVPHNSIEETENPNSSHLTSASPETL
jgi:hypothetical protein